MASKLSLFLAELKRRKVYRVAVVYVVVGAGIIGLADAALPSDVWERLQVPIVVLILVGLPIALVLAWAYEVKPEEPRKSEAQPETDAEKPEAEKKKSIVVLPFDNMSPDPGDAYFSDGLTEEIITHLSFIRSLRVISRNSAMVLKGTQKDTRTIGKELDVQFVLEGSVRKAGDDLRITAQLIDATTDEHLWAEKYDGVLEDVFGMQEDVARSIVDALQLRLGPDEARRLSEHPIQDLQAYEYFLRATQEAMQFTKEAMDRAVAYLEQALEIVGENAVLLAGLAYVHSQLANIGEDLEGSHRRAEEYAIMALNLNPECAQAHLVLGILHLIRRRPRNGVFHLEKALESNPYDSTTLIWLSVGYSLVGKSDAFRSCVERAVKADPLTPAVWSLPGFLAIMEGRFDEGVGYYQELERVDPGNPMAIYLWGLALAWGQRLEEAHAVLSEKVPEEATNSFSRFSLLLKYAIEGDTERMDRLARGDFGETLLNDTQLTAFTASVYALAGLKDRAFDWVQHAIDGGFANYPWLAEKDPFLGPYRGDPRFEELLRRVKHEWESFEV